MRLPLSRKETSERSEPQQLSRLEHRFRRQDAIQHKCRIKRGSQVQFLPEAFASQKPRSFSKTSRGLILQPEISKNKS